AAVDAQVLAHPACLRAKVAQSLLQQVSAAKEVLHQHRFTAEQIPHHEPRLAAAGQQRIVFERERSRGYLRGLAQRIVDEKLDRARCARLAGERRNRLRDESGGKREIAVDLHAAEIDLATPGTRPGAAVAQAHGGGDIRKIARESGLEPPQRAPWQRWLAVEIAPNRTRCEHTEGAGYANLGQGAEII